MVNVPAGRRPQLRLAELVATLSLALDQGDRPGLLRAGAAGRRAELGRRYDAAHEHLLHLLAEVRDHEWPLPTALPDGTPRTMETVFRQPTIHFAEHSAWVGRTLGR
jgi:hypothetical protein